MKQSIGKRDRNKELQGPYPVSDKKLMRPFLDRPGFLLARIDQIATVIFGNLCDTVTLNQAEFLLLLDRVGPMIQIALAEAAGVDKSTTAYILDNLQNRGLIERKVRAEDRRSSLIALTDAGSALIPAVAESFVSLQTQLEAPLDPLRKPLLIDMLRRLGANPESAGPVWRTACDPQEGVLDQALSFLCRRVLQLMQAQFLTSTKGYNLSLRQFSLLHLLKHRETLTQIEFARIFGLDPATCGVIIRGALRRNLVAGQPCPQDRRARRYHLTEEGRNVLQSLHPVVDRSENIVFDTEQKNIRPVFIGQLQAIIREYSYLLRFPGAL
ncbi:MarR family transcriptional regulator [Altericroceibacterium spongiae]|uniref:MarR family transcriptional regulator n=1 Tax=Altericroceibacterium spongiae TaxID=2320269 RepID=A0A420ERL4_9SPHN|nr:MarR family transcriptional regulator [Altericroceibacterium spongiae]RKF23311.1 MarR family transcriptional regulator [Altericroceibacterium spongiae]